VIPPWHAVVCHHPFRAKPTGRLANCSNLSPFFITPVVLTADQAGVIVVGESAKIEGIDFHLAPPSERTIEGVVMWPDGKPASNAEKGDFAGLKLVLSLQTR